MTDGFNSCRNVVCNFTEGTGPIFHSIFSFVYFMKLIYGRMLRCHVFLPANTLATKSNRSCEKGRKGSRCFLLSQAPGSHWHLHRPRLRIWTKRRVSTYPFNVSSFWRPFPIKFLPMLFVSQIFGINKVYW